MNTSQPRSRLMIFLSSAALYCLFLLATPGDANASHFRYGYFTWQQMGGNTIQFTITTAWRRSYFGNPNLNNVIQLGGEFPFNYGDGNTNTNYTAIVTAVNVAEDWFQCVAVITRTYNSTGNKTVFAGSCCRIGSLQNNANLNYRLESIVNVGAMPPNGPPSSTLPVLINMPTGQAAATLTVPAADPNGDPIRFRLATPAEMGTGTVHPPGLSISPTGLLTFNTIGKGINTLWNTSIVLEDLTSTNTVKSKTMLDVIIRIVNNSAPPVFIAPSPSNNTVFTVLPGNNLPFTVAADDPDNPPAFGSLVTLNVTGLPVGASMTPSLPVGPSATVTSNFSWTPTVANTGTYVISFVAEDDLGAQTTLSFTIIVPCLIDVSSIVTNASCELTSDGAIDLTVLNGAAPYDFTWANSANQPVGTTEDLTDLAPGIYRVTVVDNNDCVISTNIVVGYDVPDADNDNICDSEDNCPGVPNTDQTDTDGDLSGDACDNDDDDDDILDTEEVDCGSDPLNDLSTCEICDGLDNDLNDGVDEGFTNTDGDNLANCVDPDDDNDGITDTDEVACGSDPLNSGSTCEICDGTDNDLNDGIDEGFTDTDSDGLADCVDPDDDNDGCLDETDSDPLVYSEDSDCDGVHDDCDVCPGGDDNGPCDANVLPPIETLPSHYLCSNNNNTEKIFVCHDGNTICVSANAAQTHLNHGDFLGPCTSCHENRISPVNGSPSKDAFNDPEMELMPNPTTDKVTIRLYGMEQTESVLTVYDQLGRLMMTQTIGEGQDVLQINLQDNKFGNGNYVVRVVSGKVVLTKELMIIR